MIGLPNMRRAFTPVNELKPLDVKMMLSEFQIERKRISLGEVLMEGMKNKVFFFNRDRYGLQRAQFIPYLIVMKVLLN